MHGVVVLVHAELLERLWCLWFLRKGNPWFTHQLFGQGVYLLPCIRHILLYPLFLFTLSDLSLAEELIQTREYYIWWSSLRSRHPTPRLLRPLMFLTLLIGSFSHMALLAIHNVVDWLSTALTLFIDLGVIVVVTDWMGCELELLVDLSVLFDDILEILPLHS